LTLGKKDIEREGFAVLHGKWGGNSIRTFVAINQKSSATADKNQKYEIGYFAYPNPTLKNKIPDSKFYKYQDIFHLKSPPVVDVSFQTSGRLEQSVTKSQYIKKIKQVKELLAAGEIYQLNYAIRFRKKFKGYPYALFLKLNKVNPSDFSAYLNCGDFQIISSSPERLLKVQNGKIITQPIKGTAPKDTGYRTQNTARLSGRRAESFLSPESCVLSPESDPNLIELINSEKERAELDMITDLERNDVGKICKYGTLKLTKERKLLELKNIWHTYSQIEGQLPENIKSEEIIQAMFPGGSITGCPKKRAMEYIEKFEGMPRNIFTGSIGYISHRGSDRGSNWSTHWKMDFNIAIRTALVRNGYIEYWAGGGIVADSNPEKEYDECLLKAEKFLNLL